MKEISQKFQNGEIDMDTLVSHLAVQQGMKLDGRYETRYAIYTDWTNNGKQWLRWEVHKLDD